MATSAPETTPDEVGAAEVNRSSGKFGRGKRNKKDKPLPPSKKELKRQQGQAEIVLLKQQTETEKYILDIQDLKNFTQLPLSSLTLQGLSKSNFVELTDIQKGALPFALCARDILGAARTGSGKTLAFIIPILEILYKESWSQMDGVGAIVISPTRELALQIFEVLRKVGRYHSLSAGLLIGGKDLKSEQDRITRMNVLVCTPGRLLQHMDQTPEFICDNLQLLVLDEADRLLDSGFEKALNAIIENLPKSRQTLLFSATQTKSVRDLARLSLKNPEYIAVHDDAISSTPKHLTQKYLVCDLDKKLDVLFSFIKTHLKQKVLVFLSSCKQVRFVFETFCKMQPGIPLMCMHGKQKQVKRVAIFEQYCRKQDACLFATDIAARGLDFPAVDWVIQVDCPEDASTYIHRVGRTARYESHGQALLLLLPSERDAMLSALEQKKVPITEIKANPEKTISVQSQLAAICTQLPDIKYLGQKAFICYLRSIYLQADKNIFDVGKLPIDAFAESLGLPGAPKIKFIKKAISKNQSRQAQVALDEADDSDDIGNHALSVSQIRDKKSLKQPTKREFTNDASVLEDTGVISTPSESKISKDDLPKKPKSRMDKMFEKKNLTVLSDHYAKLKTQSESDREEDDEQDFLQIKRANHDIDESENLASMADVSITHRQRLKLKKRALAERGLGKKLIFDEEGNALHAFQMETLEDFEATRDIASRTKEYLEASSVAMQEADAVDRTVARAKLSERKRAKKLKDKADRREESGQEVQATLGSYSGDDQSQDDFVGSDDGADFVLSDEGEYLTLNEDDDNLSLNSFQKHESSKASKPIKKRLPGAQKRRRGQQDQDDDVDNHGTVGGDMPGSPKNKSKRVKNLDDLNTKSLEDLAMELLGN
ncbi:hypothetical protein BASA81_010674 [Batrachochytrium salamandrivorans]|nr:hypothetical protein BASA81_010674 [Batrachochytrium salamandrivorans]